MIKQLKKFGQNWLVNPKILEFMASSAELGARDVILEVGPGTGLLTEYLAQSGARVIAVEKDRRLVSFLNDKFKNQKNVRIIEGDILRLDPTDPRFDLKILKGRTFNSADYKIVGNIPYYLTSHLLKIIFEKWPRPEFVLFTVQKEVALRMNAKPPAMNLLALSVQLYARIEILKYISKNNFRPAPKVDSALIKIIPKPDYGLLTIDYRRKFFGLAKAAFSGKRKQLLNSLSNNLKIDKKILSRALAESGIAPTQRPESLNIEKWLKLTQSLFPEH